MADIMSLFAGVIGTVRLSLDVADAVARHGLRAIRLLELYGPSGLFLFWFGSKSTWRMEAQVLGELIDEDAMAFKKCVQDECIMVSVAAAIVAQIAMTALSLNSLSQTHWITRGLLILSLTSSLMAVYYSTTQQRVMGRLLHGHQVRLWIRGGSGTLEHSRVVPSLEQLHDSSLTKMNLKLNATVQKRLPDVEQHDLFNGRLSLYQFLPWSILSSQKRIHPCDPQAFDAKFSGVTTLKRDLMRHCFTPSVASVVTLSAPQGLLSASLGSLLIALGVYLGSTWIRNLDDLAGGNESRNVFIMYLVGLSISVLVFSISRLIQDEDKRTETGIVGDFMEAWVRKNVESVQEWGFEVPNLNGGRLYFTAPTVRP